MELAAAQVKVEGGGWSLSRGLKTCKSKVVSFARSIKKTGKDDPRRVTHSLKVGMALTLVSLLYYWRPLYDGFGVAGMWAVLTVVVVFEFTVGKLVYKTDTYKKKGGILYCWINNT